MADNRLDNSTEYLYIRELRNTVHQLVPLPENFASTAGDVVFSIADRMKKAPARTNYRESDEREMTEKRNSIVAIAIRPETVASAISDFNSELLKNIYRIFAVSNFAFVEYIFWIESDFSELKKYRNGQPNEEQNVKQARLLRKAGEDSYKRALYEDALKNFRASLEKYDQDFTVHYQMGLIYFFEKADYDLAMECFRNASKYSQGRSTQVFIHSMVMHGLTMRLMAGISGKNELFAEAYQATSQGYQADTTYYFSKYAFAQCAMNAVGRVDPVGESLTLLKELIGKEKMFLLQAIYDRAFDRHLSDIDAMVSNMYLESVNISLEVFKIIEDLLEYLGKYTNFSSIPSRHNEFRNEFRSLVDQFNRKNYFDVISVRNRLNLLFDGIQDVVKEIERNKTFFEVKDYMEKLLSKYDDEIKDAAGGTLKSEEEYNLVLKESEEMGKNFPEAASGKIGWHEGGGLLFIKVISGCFTFMLILTIIFLYSLFLEEGINSVTATLGFLNLVFLPVYGNIAGELYYAYIENKRRSIAREMTKYSKKFEYEKAKIIENEKRVKEIYTKMIAEKFKVSRINAEQIFDAAARENYDRVKSLLNL